MNRSLVAAWIVATACWTWHLAAAERPMHTPMYQQWILRRTTFALVGGRIANNTSSGWMFGVPRQTSSDGPVRETVTFNGNGTSGSINYNYQRTKPDSSPKEIEVELGIEVSSEGRFALRYSDKDEPKGNFELSQVPGQPVHLSVPPPEKSPTDKPLAGTPRIIDAPTIWHLLIIHDDDCRQGLLPTLEALRPDWRIGSIASAAEDELVKLAAVAQKPDRQQWAAWVDELGDPLYSRRDRAERKLRAVGPVILSYLTRMKSERLDTEQQFRIRRLIRVLSTQQGEDTPETIAAMLIGDPYVWLALLGRSDVATRQAAVQQLEVLLGSPVKFDAKAEPATQEKAREELRVRIEKVAGDESKSDAK